MKLNIPHAVLVQTTAPKFKSLLDRWGKFSRREGQVIEDAEFEIETGDLSLDEVKQLAKHADGALGRTFDNLLAVYSGDFGKTIPNFRAFDTILKAFLNHERIDGWVYRREQDGQLYPWLVTKVQYHDAGRNKDDKPSVSMGLTAYAGKATSTYRDNRGGMSVETRTVSFDPNDATRRRVADALASGGWLKETAELRAEYDAAVAKHQREIAGKFAQQFVFEGRYIDGGDWRNDATRPKHKVIHDFAHDDIKRKAAGAECSVYNDEIMVVPEHPVTGVFDLSDHVFYLAHANLLTPYVWDKSLGDKLVLPQSHRDLLDILTHDLDAFLGDIIEGKSAGNIILAKGVPGVGKTLTAEIYSEIIEKPVYSIMTGGLGTTAKEIEENLKTIFARQKRWGCILLLDESDVFVKTRGDNIEQNAIVAEFLRVLEYFDGLLFMTTNRPDDIDEAIISRCAAIIHYDVPSADLRERVWKVLLTNYGAKLTDHDILRLVNLFPKIAPRDVKMLSRLALRTAKFKDIPLSVDIFRQCAVFRAIEIAEEEIV